MNILNILSQPFPYNTGIRNKIWTAIWFGIYIFIFLLLFKPFGLDVYNLEQLIIISFKYGLITVIGILSGTVIFLISPSTFTESSWTTGKQILFSACIIFFVGVINYLVSPLIVNKHLNLKDALWFQGVTVVISLIPVTILILIKQNLLLKKFSAEAALLEKQLVEKQNDSNKGVSLEKIEQEENKQSTTGADIPVSNIISFIGNYHHDKIEFNAEDLFFIASASNYIKLFHLNKGKMVYSIIRMTLKRAEEILEQYPNFLKCHRAFIINLDKVCHVEGNAQGYKIKVESNEELIPISRKLNSEFADKLLAHRKK
ncbi:MAG TPA: LytTR family DNA-binding domain-containing protein [Segetibacter sp.]|jgi:DNA-binding LytR/AlgR family response regulator